MTDLVAQALAGNNGNLIADALVRLKVESELGVVSLDDDLGGFLHSLCPDATHDCGIVCGIPVSVEDNSLQPSPTPARKSNSVCGRAWQHGWMTKCGTVTCPPSEYRQEWNMQRVKVLIFYMVLKIKYRSS